MPAAPSTPPFTRPALAPGLLAAIILLAGVLIIESDWFFLIRFLITMLALIMCVFAFNAKALWWWVGLLPIAFLWNPIWLVPIDFVAWRGLHLPAAVIFITAGIFIKVPVPAEDQKNSRVR